LRRCTSSYKGCLELDLKTWLRNSSPVELRKRVYVFAISALDVVLIMLQAFWEQSSTRRPQGFSLGSSQRAGTICLFRVRNAFSQLHMGMLWGGYPTENLVSTTDYHRGHLSGK
jgi:hypothetical protein